MVQAQVVLAMTAQVNHFLLTDWTSQKEISEFYDLLSEIDLNIWEEKKKKRSFKHKTLEMKRG